MTHTLPPGWEEKTLGELCVSVLDGDWIESKDQAPAGIRLIQTGNIGVGVFLNKEQKSRFISETTFDRLHCTEVFPGDCLVSRLPDPIGRSCLVPSLAGRMITAVDCSILRFNEKEILPQYFIYHTLRNAYFHAVLKESTGTTRKRISRKKLLAVQIMFPPLPEQKRIVEKLDKIFAAIDKAKSQTEKNLQNTKDIFSSYLNNIFNHPAHSWKEKTLGEVCEIERGGSPRPIKSYLTTAPNGLNWIKIGDTSPNSKYIYSVKEKIRPEGLAKSRWVQEGDFLLSNSMSFGRPYILKTNGCIHDGWLVLKQYQSNLQCDFLYYLLSSPFVQKQFQQSAQGSTVRNLNTQRVAKIIVPIPPLPEQKRIVEKLDVLQSKTQELEKIYTQKLADLEELKQSVLQQAFSGKL